jgi:hypothetical protein
VHEHLMRKHPSADTCDKTRHNNESMQDTWAKPGITSECNYTSVPIGSDRELPV